MQVSQAVRAVQFDAIPGLKMVEQRAADLATGFAANPEFPDTVIVGQIAH